MNDERTSTEHPLEIASVRAKADYGRIGITMCPGKWQADGWSGAWARDLEIDVAAIHKWGARAVVTLVEKAELEQLRVQGLGEEVQRRHMAWFHLPIPDVTAPGDEFERQYDAVGPKLRAMIRDGFDVLVHCKGGLGRAGTVAARILVELGMPAPTAIDEVRKARPGAIETREQEDHVRGQRAIIEARAKADIEGQRDRATGALLGLAVGDALGTTLEFTRRDSYAPIADIIGGGPFQLEPGQWTDDTAMALALGESLLAAPMLDESDLMRRFVDWREKGRYSCTGECFDIGVTTAQALERFVRTGNPVAGSSDPRSAGNGSLMRLAPVAIRHWRDLVACDRTPSASGVLEDVAARQSRTTHAAPEAVDACRAFARLLASAIAGDSRHLVLCPRTDFEGAVGSILEGRWRGMHRRDVRSSGYVIDSLSAALWAVGSTGSFRSAVLAAANLGDDADTTAAIAGQLAGAIYGASAIPQDWLALLAWEPGIQRLANDLFEQGAG